MSKLYAGLSQVSYEGPPFDLGHGATIRSTYAHLFAAPLVAFARAPEGKHHPGPWRSADGGFRYDVGVELAITEAELPRGVTLEGAVQLIASLLRIDQYMYLMVPVISDQPLDNTSGSTHTALFRSFEVEPRVVTAGSAAESTIKQTSLQWVKSVWPRTAELIHRSPNFETALKAVDACTTVGRPGTAMLLAWGALELIFAPSSRSEIRFRVAANIAAYLEPLGPSRLSLFREVGKLYDARSAVAHTANDADLGDLLRTAVILRNALAKIISSGTVPTVHDFQYLLLVGEQSAYLRTADREE